jgi:hypothetical protein
MKTLLNGTLTLAIVAAGASFASAQSMIHVVADVPFAFTAGGQSLAAGNYDILRTSDTADILEFRNAATGKAVMVPFVSRLGPRSDQEAALVFDKDQMVSYLSEIHVPGEDGYLLQGAPARHTHVTVKVTRKK